MPIISGRHRQTESRPNNRLQSHRIRRQQARQIEIRFRLFGRGGTKHAIDQILLSIRFNGRRYTHWPDI